MDNRNFISIQGWMVNELHLSGNELLLYALIFGFSQDGESEYHGSQSYMAESLGITRECVVRTINKLEEKGFIIKNKKEHSFKGTIKYRAIFCCDKKSHDDVMKSHISCDEKSHNNIDNTIDDNKVDKDKSLSKKEDDDFVEEIYKMYPSKCPKRNSSLGKSSKDKDRIRKLMKKYSKEDIKRVVEYEISSKLGVSYMSNFSTFLNNFPDPDCIDYKVQELPSQNTELADGRVNSKGEIWSEQLQKWLK